MIDIHSHILYGLDDGARDANESGEMLAAAAKIGIDHIIATPHVRQLPFNRDLALERYQELLPAAEDLGICLELGFEVHWNVLLELDDAAFLEYCFFDSDILLVEFSLSAEDAPLGHEQMIYRLQRSGLHVIIAHPERYPFVQRGLEIAERWRDMGCDLQLDAVCLKHNMESGSKQAARRLFAGGQVDYLASDAHCVADYVQFGKAIDWARRH